MNQSGELARENEALRERLSPAQRGQPPHQREPRLRHRASGRPRLRPVADGSPLRRDHPPRRCGRDTGLPVVRHDRRGGRAALGPAGRDAALRVPRRHLRTSQTPRPTRPHQVHGPPGASPAPGAGAGGLLPGGPGPPPGPARGQHLPGGEGSRGGVHRGGRGDPGHVRLPGGDGHRQRPPAPGRAAGQGGSGDPDQHLAGGRGRLRRQDGSAGVVQPGGEKDRRQACGSRTSRRSSSWAC